MRCDCSFEIAEEINGFSWCFRLWRRSLFTKIAVQSFIKVWESSSDLKKTHGQYWSEDDIGKNGVWDKCQTNCLRKKQMERMSMYMAPELIKISVTNYSDAGNNWSINGMRWSTNLLKYNISNGNRSLSTLWIMGFKMINQNELFAVIWK